MPNDNPRPTPNTVRIGPWAGSNPHGIQPGKPRRGQIPNRYIDRYGGALLMECKNPQCRKPFDPSVPPPRDLLCIECRATRDHENPTLPLDEEDTDG